LIAYIRTPVTDDIVNDPIDLHTTNTVLDQYPDVRDPLIVRSFLSTQCAAFRLLLRLKDRYSRQCEALKATILPQYTALRQTILGFVCNPLIMHASCIRGAQEADPAPRIDQQHILDCMVFLLAAVVDFLLVGIFRARYRTFGSIVTKKGGASGSRVSVSLCKRLASSVALREGSKLWLAKACSRMSSSSRTHLLTLG